MKVFILLVALYLAFSPTNCFALQNPLDNVGDAIKKKTDNAVDDTISKIRIAAHDAQKEMKDGVKNFMKWLFTQIASIATILGVGYTFTFLVPKDTAKLMIIVTILCAFNNFLKLFCS